MKEIEGKRSENRWIDERYLRETSTLSPNATVMTEDSSMTEMTTINVTEKVIINVSLPRHGSQIFSGK